MANENPCALDRPNPPPGRRTRKGRQSRTVGSRPVLEMQPGTQGEVWWLYSEQPLVGVTIKRKPLGENRYITEDIVGLDLRDNPVEVRVKGDWGCYVAWGNLRDGRTTPRSNTVQNLPATG